MRNLLIALVISFSSITSAFASNWHYSTAGNDETYFYFDADTIEKNKDKTILLWIKTVQTEKPESDNSWATAARWKIHCAKRTIQSLMMSMYDEGGKFMKSISTPGPEQNVIPDSTGEAILKIACDPTFPNDKTASRYFKLENNDPLLSTRNIVNYKKSQVDQAPK
jgi:hypothetical protein